MEDWELKNLSALDQAQLVKWRRFIIEEEALWRQVIAAKYGLNGEKWIIKCVNRGYSTVVWKACGEEWKNAAGNMVFRIGNRRKIKFWTGSLCDNVPLAEDLQGYGVWQQQWLDIMLEITAQLAGIKPKRSL